MFADHGDSVGLCSLSSVRPWTVTVHSGGFIAPLRIMVYGFMLNHGATSADSQSPSKGCLRSGEGAGVPEAEM